MYSFSTPSKTIAIVAGFALMSATPVAAGKNSVVGTSTATTALGAVSTVPGSGGGSPIGSGGGSAQTGFSGPALFSVPAGSLPPSAVSAFQGFPGAAPTTLNGAPATAVSFTQGSTQYVIVVTASGAYAVYPVE